MNRPLQLLRISAAIMLIMVVSMLPHHHHHGEVYGLFDTCLTHQHTDNCTEEETPNLPCDENSCYLQAMKFFTQVERPDEIYPLLFDLLQPEEIVLLPNFCLFHHRIAPQSYLLHSGNLPKHYLRGPPVC